jgi:hypothetical protein
VQETSPTKDEQMIKCTKWEYKILKGSSADLDKNLDHFEKWLGRKKLVSVCTIEDDPNPHII